MSWEVSFDIRDLEKYSKHLDTVEPELKHQTIPNGLMALTTKIIDLARFYAPVKTGHLRRTGFKDPRLLKENVALMEVYAHKVGREFNYAAWVETPPYGEANHRNKSTNFTSPQFIKRAIDETLPKHESKLLDKISEDIIGE